MRSVVTQRFYGVYKSRGTQLLRRGKAKRARLYYWNALRIRPHAVMMLPRLACTFLPASVFRFVDAAWQKSVACRQGRDWLFPVKTRRRRAYDFAKGRFRILVPGRGRNQRHRSVRRIRFSAFQRLWRQKVFFSIPLNSLIPMAQTGDRLNAQEAIRWLPSIEIDGFAKTAFLMYPAASVSYRVFIPPRAVFSGFIGLMPDAWEKRSGDVVFEVKVLAESGNDRAEKRKRTGRRRIHNCRRWRKFRLNLARFAGQEVILALSTAVRIEETGGYAWAVWGEPTLLIRKDLHEITRLFFATLKTHGALGFLGKLVHPMTHGPRTNEDSFALYGGASPFAARNISLTFKAKGLNAEGQNGKQISPAALAAIEKIDESFQTPAFDFVAETSADEELADLVKAYFFRIAEATTPSVRHRAVLPKSEVNVNVDLLKKDFLSLVFLYHLFSFRDVELTPYSNGSCSMQESKGLPSFVMTDPEAGIFKVRGDGKQTLTFSDVKGSGVIERQIGLCLRDLSLEFIRDAERGGRFDSRMAAASFSIVMPVYDRTRDLMEALSSVLNQNYPWCEIVLVFNGSPVETLRLVPKIRSLVKARRFRLKMIVLPIAYGSANCPRNIGCFASTGDFIIFLDSDDWLQPPDFISRLAQVIANASDRCSIFYPKTVEFINVNREHPIQGHLTATRPPFCDWGVLYDQGNVLNNSGVCVSKRAFELSGGINPFMDYCEDYELFLRLVGAEGYGVPFDSKVKIKLHDQNNEIRFEGQKKEWETRAKACAEAFVRSKTRIGES